MDQEVDLEAMQTKHCQEPGNERPPASHVRAILNRLIFRGLNHYIKPRFHLLNTSSNLTQTQSKI